MEHRIYRVVQDRPGKMPLSYYSTDDIRDLCGFLQYFLDNADPKGLEAFTIVTTAKGISKGRPFLEVTGGIIRKRTFEERMAGKEIPDEVAEAIGKELGCISII